MAIILFTGSSATGKSTIARRIADLYQIPIINEREMLKKMARDRGFARTRHWLDAIGTDRFLDEALQQTIQELTLTQGTHVIIDGSYDRRLPETLRQKFDKEKLLIITVTAPESTREMRNMQRMGSTLEESMKELHLIDAFKEYAGTLDIEKEATFTIQNDDDLDKSIRQLKEYLDKELWQTPYGPERR